MTFSHKTLILGQVQCLSHNGDQKFVTSLVQSAICSHSVKKCFWQWISLAWSTLNGKWRLLGLHASDKFFWATPFPLKKGRGGFGVIVHKLQLFSGCQSHVLQLQIMKSIFKVPHFSIKTLLILTLSTHMTWCIIYPLHSFLATIYHLNYHIYSNKRPPPPPPTWATVRLKLKLKLNKY